MSIDPTFTGLFSPAPRRTSVTNQIKDYILIHRLHPGDPMPTEAELCADLGVSRSSVREAMRTLAALDIVEVRHGYGTFVGQLSLAPLVEGLVFRGVLGPEDDFSTLREVVEVREALDLAMAEQICAALKGTDTPELSQIVATMEAKSADSKLFTEEDRAFHAALLAHLDNALVGQLVTALWEVHNVVYPRLGLSPVVGLDETARAHGQMMRAAQSGDVQAYRQAVVQHYLPIRRALDAAGD